MNIAENGVVRQLPTNHGHFIAGMKLRTVDAILVNLVRQLFPLGNGEPEPGEKIRDARKQAHALNMMMFRFDEQRVTLLARIIVRRPTRS